jgi:hypothetical protein
MKNLKIKLISQIAIIMLLLVYSATQSDIEAQALNKLYAKSTIQLKTEPGYASKNNWEQLFPDAGKMEFGKNTGMMKEIVVAPDGSVFMCHKTLYEIWKFDKNGNFMKKFGSKGSKPGQFTFHFSIYGLLDSKYLFTADNQGKMQFFDTEGNFIKKLQINYMPLDMVPLKNSKIAILGFEVGNPGRNIIAIKDFNTGKEKIIWSQNEENADDNSIVVKIPNGCVYSWWIPYCHSSLSRPRIATASNGNLILGTPANGMLTEYTPEGVKLRSFVVKINPKTITDADIQDNYEIFAKKSDEFAAKINGDSKMSQSQKEDAILQFKSQLGKVKNRDTYPKHLPYFSSIIVDSDGNILVFEFTKDDESNKFEAYAYDISGNEIGESSFESGDYDLSYIPSSFVYRSSQIYAVAKSKKGGKVPLRLVKFKPE